MTIGKSVAQPASEFPRLHVEQLPEPLPMLATESPSLAAFCGAFCDATGWRLEYRQAEPSARQEHNPLQTSKASGQPVGAFTLAPAWPASTGFEPTQAPLPADVAQELAVSFAGVVQDLERVRHALWEREAELAAGVPVALRSGDERRLADRLESVLRGGAEAVGCQAAGLYLLDDATSELKLRAACGLPPERFLEPARPLRGALADLEALIGHAVVLEDVAVLPHWKAPENFPSAVCVPVASETTPLGTLWLFCTRRRDFTPAETNLAEIVAGRIASDLEREMLRETGFQGRRLARERDEAADWRRCRLPRAQGMLEGWQLAGHAPADSLGAGFYDWLALPDGVVAALAGGATGPGLTSALTATAVHAAARALAARVNGADDWVARVREFFSHSSPGGESASLLTAFLAPHVGRVRMAAAGKFAVWRVSAQGCRRLPECGAALEQESEAPCPAIDELLEPHDALVAVLREGDGLGSLPENLLCESLFDRRKQTAATLLETTRAALASQPCAAGAETTVLVIKRRP